MRETSNLPTASLRAPNHHPSFHSQSPRAPTSDAKFAVSRILQNSTKLDRIRQKSTETRARPRAHARGNDVPLGFSRHGLPTSQRIGRIPWSPRPRTVMPIDRTEPPLLDTARRRIYHGKEPPGCAGRPILVGR